MGLERPLALLLPAVAAAVFVAARRRGRGGAVPVPLVVWGGTAVPPPGYLLRMARGLSAALYWAAIASAVVAAAGPVRVERSTVYLDRGTDIVFAIDTSPSMAALDFGSGSRLQGAVAAASSFIAGRPADPIGLVSFGEAAGLRAPLSYDHAYLADSLDRLRIMESGDGTAIGMGVSVAAAHLQAVGAAGGVIILVTDGENTSGPIAPDAAAGVAAELGYTIHAIGVGSDQPTVIELADPGTGVVRRGRYQGQPDPSLLQALAERTGGRFAWAADPAELRSILAQLDRAERPERRTRLVVGRRAAGRPFVLAALIGLLLHVVVRRALLREAV